MRLCRPLPISFPVTAQRRFHRVRHEDLGLGRVTVLKPCGVVRMLVKVLRANVVVLALHHAAQAREVAFDHVCVLAVNDVSAGLPLQSAENVT